MFLNALTDFEKKQFFLQCNHSYLLVAVSMHIDFTFEEVQKYEPIINIYELARNPNVRWNTALIDAYAEAFFTEEIPYCFGIHLNKSLPWSIEFIKRYEKLRDWSLLAQNDGIIGNPELRKHFSKELEPYHIYPDATTEIATESFASKTLNDLKFAFESLECAKEYRIIDPSEIDGHIILDWTKLSRNNLLPWSEELIEKYANQWDWTGLSYNESVPWNLHLLRKFEDRIDWTVCVYDDEDCCQLFDSISLNMEIPWDADMINMFYHKLDPNFISMNPKIKWNIDLLLRFNHFWDTFHLAGNKLIWDKVFYEFHDKANLFPLLDELILIHTFNHKEGFCLDVNS